MNDAERIVSKIDDDQTVRVPIVEETLQVGKRIVEQGGVRIVKTVSTEESTISEPTVQESATIDRVSVNRFLEYGEALPVERMDGDTLIIPVFEEVVVVEKRIRLTEELHIRRTRQETVTPQTVTLRREAIRVEPIQETNGSEN